MEWRPKKWDGPLQYEDVDTGELMMLPTDLVIKTDPAFRVFCEMYAKDEALFFKDFAEAFGRLISLGVTHSPLPPSSLKESASAEFREAAMHGSLGTVKKLSTVADVHEVEKSSGRNALHKAAFWGHDGTIDFLLSECKLDPNVKDLYGDTALHDAARFGHMTVIEHLLKCADVSVKNNQGKTALEVAADYNQEKVVERLKGHLASKL